MSLVSIRMMAKLLPWRSPSANSSIVEKWEALLVLYQIESTSPLQLKSFKNKFKQWGIKNSTHGGTLFSHILFQKNNVEALNRMAYNST
jgi:hypothetical protein